MASPFLKTKLYLPSIRNGLVPRPRLFKKLDACLIYPLTLVSAPAGFGKSTLVSQWIHLRQESTLLPNRRAWLSLDPEDNSSAQFWGYVISALEEMNLDCDALDQARSLLQGQKNPPIRPILTELINQFTEVQEDQLLVLDDFHAIQSQEILDEMVFFIEHMPPKMHLVLATRSDPSLPLGRWRVRGLLNEIRLAELRFNLAEAETFFNQVYVMRLDPRDIAELEQRTEGWIAGLQMAALALQGTMTAQLQWSFDNRGPVEVSKYIARFSGQHHLILDYLTDEVLLQQPEPIQDFLLKTSVLSQLCPSLCDAVVIQEADPHALRSKQILEHLERSNLFIIPLDNERIWYRYHHLFGELLLARLRERYLEWISDLHRRAASWYESNNFPFEAMQHALAAQDQELAADLIERAVRKPSTWTTGQVARMLDAVNELPEAAVEARPWLRVFLSMLCFSNGQVEIADQMLSQVEEKLSTAETQVSAESEKIALYANTLRGFYAATRGDVRTAMQRSQRTLAVCSDDSGRVYGYAVATQASVARITGRVDEANQLYQKAIDNQKRLGASFTAVIWTRNLADVLFTQGRLHEAAKMCKETIRCGTLEDQPTLNVGHVQAHLAAILYEWDQLEEAEETLYAGLRLLQKGGLTPNFGRSHATLALVQQALGKTEEASDNMNRAIQSAQTEMALEQMLAFQARLWLAQGEARRSLAWAENYSKYPATQYLRELEDLTLAKVWLHENRLDEGLILLGVLIDSAEKAGRYGPLIEALAARALALYQQLGQKQQAQETLLRALHLSMPEDYVRTFLDIGTSMESLLRTVSIPDRSLAEYRDRLVAGFHRKQPFQPPQAPVGQTNLVEKLSERELEILRLIAAGFSNGQIAKQLYLTLNTVGAHTSHIFGKLGVHSRTEAVARARELNIL